MLPLLQRVHLGGPHRIDPQLIVSTWPESGFRPAEFGFRRVLLAGNKHKQQPLRQGGLIAPAGCITLSVFPETGISVT